MPSSKAPISVIDLEIEAHDHLSSLPSEVLQLITSYLLSQHDPDRAFRIYAETLRDCRPVHSLVALSASCKRLYGEVSSWAHHFLYEHRNVTKYKDYKTAKARAKQNLVKVLLQWSCKHCVFCGKKSARRAIMMNGYACCADCDKSVWPDKITKTQAKAEYDLKDHQLLPDKHRSGSRLLAKHPGLPKLWYGTFISNSVATTMFMRADVERLAKLAHGDLKAHLQQRAEAREERQRKIKATQERRQAEQQTILQQKQTELDELRRRIREDPDRVPAAMIDQPPQLIGCSLGPPVRSETNFLQNFIDLRDSPELDIDHEAPLPPYFGSSGVGCSTRQIVVLDD